MTEDQIIPDINRKEIEIIVQEKDIQGKETKKEAEVGITKIDTIVNKTKEEGQDKDNFQGTDKPKDKECLKDKNTIVLGKIGDKITGIKTKDFKKGKTITLEDDHILTLHQEDPLQGSIKTEDPQETIISTILTIKIT